MILGGVNIGPIFEIDPFRMGHNLPQNWSKILEICDFWALVSEKLKTDYFVHGTDWKKGPQKKVRDQLIKKVKIWGGRVIEIPYTKNISSSKLKKV